MKTIFGLLLSLQLVGSVWAQNNPGTMEQNGWKFLEWGMEIEEVKSLLEEHYLSWDVEGTALSLQREDKLLKTQLWFDESSSLDKVTEVRKFHLLEKEEAKAYFQQRMEELEADFGQPTLMTEDTENDVTTLVWEMENTVLSCQFDHQYKVIDEFGMDSYRVDVVFISTTVEEE